MKKEIASIVSASILAVNVTAAFAAERDLLYTVGTDTSIAENFDGDTYNNDIWIKSDGAECVNNALQMTSHSSQFNLDKKLSDFVMEYDITPGNGWNGLIFNKSEHSTTWDTGGMMLYIRLENDAVTAETTSKMHSSTFPTGKKTIQNYVSGEPVHVKVEVKNDIFKCYINNELFYEYSNIGYTPGYVGFYKNGTGTTVIDNVKITEVLDVKENFDGNTFNSQNWINGGAECVNNVLEMTADKTQFNLNKQVSNFTIEYDIVPGRNWTGLIFNKSEHSTTWDTGGMMLYITNYAGDGSSVTVETTSKLHSSTFPFAKKTIDDYTPGEPIHVKVEVKDDTFKCYIDNELFYEYSNIGYTPGYVGFYKNGSGTTLIDNVKVTDGSEAVVQNPIATVGKTPKEYIGDDNSKATLYTVDVNPAGYTLNGVDVTVNVKAGEGIEPDGVTVEDGNWIQTKTYDSVITGDGMAAFGVIVIRPMSEINSVDTAIIE